MASCELRRVVAADECVPFLEDPEGGVLDAEAVRYLLGHEPQPQQGRGRLVAAAGALLLLAAGVAGWAHARLAPQGIERSDRDAPGVTNLVLVTDVPSDDSTTTLLREESVEAMTQEAEALRAKAQEAMFDVKVMEEVTAKEMDSMKALVKEANAQLSDAVAIHKAARMKEASAKEDMQDARVVNATAHEEEIAAMALRKQAEWEIAGAKAMVSKSKNSKVAEAIGSMAKTQQDSANEAMASAQRQREAAQSMEDKAGSMKEKASEDLQVARIIQGMVEKEANTTRQTKAKAAAWASVVHNITEETDAMKAQAEKDTAHAETIESAAAKTSQGLVQSRKDEEDAQMEVVRANSTWKKAMADLNNATNMSVTANKSLVAAIAVTKQISVQLGAIKKMADSVDGLSNEGDIQDMAAAQIAATAKMKAKAVKEIHDSQQLIHDSLRMQAEAKQALHSSEAGVKAATEKAHAALALHDSLVSDELIEKAASHAIEAMRDSALSDLHAAKALENMAVKDNKSAAELAETARAGVRSGKAIVKTDQFEDAFAQKAIVQMSRQIIGSAYAMKEQADQFDDNVDTIVQNAEQLNARAADRMDSAQDEEEKLIERAVGSRTCVNLPGVRMKAGAAVNFSTIMPANDLKGEDPEECTLKCRQHRGCKMSVFTVAGKTCALFDEQSSQAVEFTDGYNSSYCGSLAESDSMMDKMRNLYKMKPYIPPVVQCSWAGEDCGQTQCCNNIDCNWDYTKCTGYKCFKKDALFAGCKPGSAPAVWDGLELGGQRQPREVAKAKEGILTQGTSLFCISVVMWHAGASKPFYDTEADIANNWMQKGMGIMQCEDHMVIDGVTAPLSTWGSYSNIDAFIQIWDGVRKDGRYLQHDWVVKVDPDAVFFPDRLRSHISKLGPPQGSRVYLLNNEYRFQFMGALEVMTREAATLYFENAHVCNKGAGGHTGGEDYYMKTCLNGIGVDFQKDYALLHDKYAAQDDGCANGWSAAFHFFKKVSSWEECHQQALDAR